jgi:DNA-binding response OmpR family regulator
MLDHLKVLVAHPDPGIRRLLRRHFEQTSCTTIVTQTGQETLSLLKRSLPDLIVASAAMPDTDGLSFTRALRETVGVPLMMLVPHGTDLTVTQILDCGADEFIEEPFMLNEFGARARRLLVRGGMKYRSKILIQGLGLLEIEPLDRTVRLGGVSIALTRKEFGLLAVLAAANGQIVSYEDILRKLWGSDYIGAIQNLRRVVSSLRQKIEPDASRPVHLTSVRGSGYRLSAASSAVKSISGRADESSEPA